jgi:hypothetical protein
MSLTVITENAKSEGGNLVARDRQGTPGQYYRCEGNGTIIIRLTSSILNPSIG